MPTEEKGVVPRPNQSKKVPTGNNYLLAISIDQYEYAPPLSNCVRDAQAFIEILTSKYNFATKKEGKQFIFHLSNKEATRKNILKKLTELKRKVTSNDNLIIYFSGHGETEDNTGFWIPVEAHPEEEDEFISTDEIKRKLNAINSFHTFLLVDACFSGSLFLTHKSVKAGVESKPSRWGLAASHSREVALDGTPGENSPFSKGLLKALKNSTEDLSIHELSNALIKEVARSTRNKQTPVFQPLDLKGHELGQYVFHLKEDKEAQLIAELEASLKEDIALMEAGQIKKAKRNLNGLLKEVKEEIKQPQQQERLIRLIEEQVEICKNIPKYQAIIEKFLLPKKSPQLDLAKQEIFAKEKLLKSLAHQLEKAKIEIQVLQKKEKGFNTNLAENAAANSQLEKDIKEGVKSLEHQLEKAKTEIQGLQKKEKRFNTNLAENAAANSQLQSAIQQKNIQISQLEKAIKEEKDIYLKAEGTIRELRKKIAELEKESAAKKKSLATIKKSSPVFQDSIGEIPIEMIWVKGGTFKLGGDVTLDDYRIGKYPVTQELWETVMGNNPAHSKGNPKCPIEKVSWDDAQEFIKKLNQKTGKSYRLSTEAEWEFAARGGIQSKGFEYAGSNNLEEVGWYKDNANGKTHPVGAKTPNELDIHDMSGNIWEWCQDWYGDYPSSPQKNPQGAKSGSYRVLRGGGWYNGAEYSRVSNRDRDYPGPRDSYNGFRLAHSSAGIQS